MVIRPLIQRKHRLLSEKKKEPMLIDPLADLEMNAVLKGLFDAPIDRFIVHHKKNADRLAKLGFGIMVFSDHYYEAFVPDRETEDQDGTLGLGEDMDLREP